MTPLMILYFSWIAFLLIAIAICDFLYFRIPNVFVLILLFTIVLPSPSLLTKNYLWPLVTLIIGVGLSALNIMGYGDVKLLSTLLLGVPQSLSIKLFMYTIILGGIFAITHILFKQYLQQIRLFILKNRKVRYIFDSFIDDAKTAVLEVKSGVYKNYLPYGVNIAFAGIACYFMNFFILKS